MSVPPLSNIYHKNGWKWATTETPIWGTFWSTLGSPPLPVPIQVPILPNPNKICCKTDYNYCPVLDKSVTCFSSVTTLKYIVPSRISFKLNNLDYLLTCTRWQLQYVGETYRSLKERPSEHLHDIDHKCNPQHAPPYVIVCICMYVYFIYL